MHVQHWTGSQASRPTGNVGGSRPVGTRNPDFTRSPDMTRPNGNHTGNGERPEGAPQCDEGEMPCVDGQRYAVRTL